MPQRPQPSTSSDFPTTFPSIGSHFRRNDTIFSEQRELASSLTLPPLTNVDTRHNAHFLNYDTSPPLSGNPRALSPIDVPMLGTVPSSSFGGPPVPSHSYEQNNSSSRHISRQKRTKYNSETHLPPSQGSAPPRNSLREGDVRPSNLHTQYEPDVSRHQARWTPLAQTPDSETYNPRKDLLDTKAEGSNSGTGFTDQQQFRLTSINESRWTGTSGDHSLDYSPSSVSDYSSDGRLDEEEEFKPDNAVQKSKKRRQDPIMGDYKRSRNPNRKTAVACNFCRGKNRAFLFSGLKMLILRSMIGRKLRCDGVKPTCSNCIVRKFECEYVPIQRRRGPGKAPKGPKGAKSRKSSATTGRSEASSSTSLPVEVTESTMSVETNSPPTMAERQPPPPRTQSRRRGRGTLSPSGDSDWSRK
ncbi:hypothetical protein H0H93_012771 [Arthromyces matolae]|nr:hypothetical protein H0H93_012771 [Arthromyces matolae]